MSPSSKRRWGYSHDKGATLNTWKEDDMQNAILEWRSENPNNRHPLREIDARALNIPYATSW